MAIIGYGRREFIGETVGFVRSHVWRSGQPRASNTAIGSR